MKSPWNSLVKHCLKSNLSPLEEPDLKYFGSGSSPVGCSEEVKEEEQ